jgi:UDP-2,3-diacylglucosamine hydrolase
MTTLFISDLHLDDARPESTALFESFVQREASKAEALYILGDLFEYWLGDDIRTGTGQRVTAALSGLAAAGIPCYFMHGNRDFLLGRRYSANCGLQLLPEECVIELYGKPTLLMHGDTLCTDDIKYQEARSMLRSEDWQKQFLASTPDEREAYVRNARQQSREHQQSVSMDIMDVNADAVRAAFERHGVTELIHGHTHRPAVHEFDLGDLAARRTVLGDWYKTGSVLRVSPRGAELEQF